MNRTINRFVKSLAAHLSFVITDMMQKIIYFYFFMCTISRYNHMVGGVLVSSENLL